MQRKGTTRSQPTGRRDGLDPDRQVFDSLHGCFDGERWSHGWKPRVICECLTYLLTYLPTYNAWC